VVLSVLTGDRANHQASFGKDTMTKAHTIMKNDREGFALPYQKKLAIRAPGCYNIMAIWRIKYEDLHDCRVNTRHGRTFSTLVKLLKRYD
jgi:hypothetical protein